MPVWCLCSLVPSWQPGLDDARQHSSPISRPPPAHPISHSSRPHLLDIVAARDLRYFLLHTPPPLILRLLLLPPAQTPPAQPHDRADTRDCLLFVAGTLPLRHSHRHELGTQRHANDDIPAGVFTSASLPRTDTPASHDHSTGDLGSPAPGGG